MTPLVYRGRWYCTNTLPEFPTVTTYYSPVKQGKDFYTEMEFMNGIFSRSF
jgi:hypothetical protein